MKKKIGTKVHVGELVSGRELSVVELRAQRAEFLARRIGEMNPLGEIARDLNDLDALGSEIDLLGDAELEQSGTRHRHKMRLEIIKTRLNINTRLLRTIVPDISALTIGESEDSEAAMLRKVPKVTLRIIHGDKDSKS